MSLQRAVAWIIIGLSVAGCRREKFEIVMQRSDGGAVRRTVTVWAVDTDGQKEVMRAPGETIAARLTGVYGPPAESADVKQSFSKVFTTDLPSDLEYFEYANFARVDTLRSPLGETLAYVERMPGEKRMLDVARVAEQAVDLLIEAWVAYAARCPDLQREPAKLAKLETFLRGEFRDDMLDFGLTLWLMWADAEESSDSEIELQARAGTWLVERGYMPATDISDPTTETAMMRAVVRKIAAAMGDDLDAPSTCLVEALRDTQNATSVGLASIGRSEEELTSASKRLVGELLEESAGGTIVWRGVPEPAAHNGEWDAGRRELRWTAETQTGARLPDVLFARWAMPDRSFQEAHVGRVVGNGTLEAFNRWYGRLTRTEQPKCAEFLRGLSPGPGLVDKLARFDLAADGCLRAEAVEEAKLPEGILVLLVELRPAEGK